MLTRQVSRNSALQSPLVCLVTCQSLKDTTDSDSSAHRHLLKSYSVLQMKFPYKAKLYQGNRFQ